MSEKQTEKHEFKTEVQKLLSIITHSLYTNREIFLRELISNASDALDKLRFETSKGGDVRDPEAALEIRVDVDKDKKILTVTDTGVGMTREELIENVGTIAHSGSEAFLKKLAEQPAGENKLDPDNIIGRFGVGFYSVFMISDQVRIVTQSCLQDAPACVWISDGLGSYELAEASPEEAPKRGTRIEIHIPDEHDEYLDKSRLERIIKKHSSFISFPIYLEGEKVNTIPALWREPKFNITSQQYEEFYKFLTYDTAGPLDTIHTSVDAPVQFNSLLFVPEHGNDFMGFGRKEYGLDLYVKRVLIQKENSDIIPEYLGFLKGVVDTEDLPLNISRETLQENLLIRKISQTLVKQVLNHLAKMAKDNKETYEKFWDAHGKVFRMGYADFANKEKFAPLVRFNSSIHEDAKGITSFDEYIARAKPDQKEIYYIAGPSRDAVRLNPHIEIFAKKGIEVLYLYDPVEEILMDAVREFGDFKLVSVEHADLSKVSQYADVDESKPKAEELDDEGKKTLDQLLERIKEILGERVTEVRISTRLQDSPCCLVSPDGGLTSSMQKILQIVSKDTAVPSKVMEINPDHPLVRNLLRIYHADAKDGYLERAVEQLYDSSLLLEGYLSDPHRLVQRINSLLEDSSSWYRGIKDL